MHTNFFPELLLPDFGGEPLSIVEVGTKSTWSTTGPSFTHNSNPEWAANAPSGSSELIEILNNYRYGIEVHMIKGITMTAKFDFQAVVNTLLAGVVLLGKFNLLVV